ncbi:MAG: DUF1553 domain-containing protein [Planctomycetes bacterium]|nr:DUF1553 domain-containing protein [Planctomycetota bacterium]
MSPSVFPLSCVLLCLSSLAARGQDAPSYHAHIAPILKAKCAGCHQPAKRKGKFDLTTHAGLLKGGKHGAAFVAGDAAKSLLIRKVGGEEPEMPPEGDPLTEAEVKRICDWIEAGGVDDTPSVGARLAGPPVSYKTAPANGALAYAPDGSLLAIGGYHEVLLHDAAGHGLVARLPGDSPHIASLAFSADGSRLCVAGGAPGQFGEVQIWDVAERKLHRKYRVTNDTLFGVSLSPDKKRIAFGCADKTVRMLDVDTGAEQLLFRNHADWVLGTCFTKDGKRLVSGGRDKAIKIIDLEHGRFVDDINNPIEGVLSLARHPEMDTVVYGGALGTPFIYKISDNQKRTAARRDTNLVHKLERQSGSVHAVAYSNDGKLIAAGGGDPAVRIHDAKSGQRVALLEGHAGAVFGVAFHPDGAEVTTCGQDGKVRVYEARSGKLRRVFTPVPMGAAASEIVMFLEVAPRILTLCDGRDERGVLVWSWTRNGRRDISGEAELAIASHDIAAIVDRRVVAKATGKTSLMVSANGLVARIPVVVLNADVPPVHFVKDVMPIMSSVGCSAGTCHGRQGGQNGFALSLRGFDPETDHRSLVQALLGRRLDRVDPVSSLMLKKPTGQIPHEGGAVLESGSRRYGTLLRWIEEGATYLKDASSKVTRLEVLPSFVDLALPTDRQRIVVVAHYENGGSRDVTRDAIIESANLEVATAEGNEVTAARRGESAVLVRYEGVYASSRISVMGDRSGFAWKPGPVHNFIDTHVHKKLEKIKALPSALCSDGEFARRIYLDLTGRPPTAQEAQAFSDDERPGQGRREALIDALVGSPAFVEHWANKWADLLQCQTRTLGEKGVWVFRRWLSRSVAENKPYDDFVKELLTTGGSTYRAAASNYLRAVSDKGQTPDPGKLTEDVAQTFLGVRFNCNKCHNHPFERWTQDQYYEFSAHFARVRFKNGTAPGEKVVYESYDGGETVHPRTSRVMAPKVPLAESLVPISTNGRLDRLAVWLTSKENPLFARSYVNRVWSYFLGVGIIEPVDDIRAGNPPVNPELLDALERHFIDSDFDFNELVRTICLSATYQMSFRPNQWNDDDATNFSHCVPRRLSAEQLMEAIAMATGVTPRIGGLPAGTRPVEAPDGLVANGDFLKLFGRPQRDSACECARTNNLSLAHALSLVNGETIHASVVDAKGLVSRVVAGEKDDREVVKALYWATLCRAPTKTELDTFGDLGGPDRRLETAQDIMWALINSPAFLFNR